jgi:hypothetical protein
VELVVSGRIAAILPFPDEANGFSAAIAENVLLNEVAEMLETERLDVVASLDLVVKLEVLEPQPATATAAATEPTTIAALILGKCMGKSSSIRLAIRK